VLNVKIQTKIIIVENTAACKNPIEGTSKNGNFYAAVYPLFLLKIVFFDEMKVIGDECAQVLRLFFFDNEKIFGMILENRKTFR
jgi:hypothetical protein